jgi:replicative DNA helicase
MNTPDTLLPNNTEFEQVVIASLLTDVAVAYPPCAELFGDDHEVFYDIRHRTLYEIIGRMTESRKPVSTLTVYEQLKMDGLEENAGGLAYLAALPDKCISPAGVEYFAGILMEYRQKRLLIEAGTYAASQAQSGGFVDIAELITKTSNDIARISKPARREMAGMRDLIIGAIDEIEQCHKGQGKLPGISTGYPDIDKMTSGLHSGDMVVIAARPSMGKTSLVMNIAEHVAVNDGLPVGVFSLEMTAKSLALRMLCSRARVNLRSIREGFITERDFPKLTAAGSQLAKAAIIIDDTAGLSIFELRNRAKQMKERHGIKLIAIDYLQLMRGSNQRKTDNRQTEVAEISNGCKILAKEMEVPVIVLSQMNRDVERDKNRRPRLSDLRESGAIEQDADMVAFLWRPGKADNDEDDISADAAPVTLTIAKQRNGPTGDVHLTFLKGYTRFESAAKVSYSGPSYDAD